MRPAGEGGRRNPVTVRGPAGGHCGGKRRHEVLTLDNLYFLNTLKLNEPIDVPRRFHQHNWEIVFTFAWKGLDFYQGRAGVAALPMVLRQH
jgi:hypothetical protein